MVEFDVEGALGAAFPGLVDAEVEHHFFARGVGVAEVGVGAFEVRGVPFDGVRSPWGAVSVSAGFLASVDLVMAFSD